jgi:hypothetical protein
MPILEWKALRSKILRILSATDSTVKQVVVAGNSQLGQCGASAIRHRLKEGEALLERLDAERESRGNPSFGKACEERVVWGELLELELQDVDEQLSRICNGAEGPRSSKANPRKGGSCEHDDS